MGDGDLSEISIYVSTTIVPFGAFVANILMRRHFVVQQTAAGDFFLLLIVTDLAFVSSQSAIAHLIADQGLVPEIGAVLAGLIMFGLIGWGVALSAEKAIREQNKELKLFPFLRWLFSWSLAITLCGLHVVLFAVNDIGGFFKWPIF